MRFFAVKKNKSALQKNSKQNDSVQDKLYASARWDRNISDRKISAFWRDISVKRKSATINGHKTLNSP
jgi:hypothetical protein